MDGRSRTGYTTCLMAPNQGYTSGYNAYGANCVTTIPKQQDGYVIPADYRFSEGYSMDYYNFNKGGALQSTLECDPALYKDFQYPVADNSGYTYPAPEQMYRDYPYTGEEYNRYMEVLGTEQVPQVRYGESELKTIQLVNDAPQLTTEFFASNAAFQRIPLYPSRTVFRRRRQGDPINEWSNAFINEEDDLCDATQCCTG
ncbi:hypothetical protein, conserved [Babesia bigemina]|uniref:Uncharacterized protein n=1 Tax=Babesia bigemina TaxID=5866 RepID=A0A061D836_BABBI|nr:hypothetical protein, conserved [Babesia bigemina]CDR96703.1 hypothetical protein, conserved [Babesia bigemina]|eukprot:XP_012768889.1 hypothetical protein, conserved [Babesia bigemina]